MDVWSLEVTLSVILVSLGRLWTCLVPRGVQGADLVEIVRSSGALLAPFWSHFWSETVMCLRCFFRCFVECLLYGFWVVLGVLLRGVWTFFPFFFEIVNMWKLAPRLHESSIFKVWRGLVLYIFVFFCWGLVSGWLRERILSDFGFILEFILAAKIDGNSIEIPTDFWGIPGETSIWDNMIRGW